jgi:hypothetical protein
MTAGFSVTKTKSVQIIENKRSFWAMPRIGGISLFRGLV